VSLLNSDTNTLEFCFSSNANSRHRDLFAPASATTASGGKLGRSLSFQSNFILDRTDSNLCVNTTSSGLAAMESTTATISNSTPIIQEYVEHICEPTTITTKEQIPKTGFSTSMQDLLLQEFLTKSSTSSSTSNVACSRFPVDATACASNIAESALVNADENIAIAAACSTTKTITPSPKDEYFVLPKLLIRENSPPIASSSSQSPSTSLTAAAAGSALSVVKESNSDLLDVASGKQASAESLIEFYENLTSSSTSSLASKINEFECFHQPPGNRFYHSDLDLNQLNDRFRNNLSISNQNINTSEGNLGVDLDWTRSNLLLLSINQTMKDDEPHQTNEYNIIEDVNYDKFLNDLLNNESIPQLKSSDDKIVDNDDDDDDDDLVSAHVTKSSSNSNNNNNNATDANKAGMRDNEMIDLFGNDVDSNVIMMKKMSARRNVTPLKKPLDKLKSFSSNPQLGNHNALSSTHESGGNLAATSTTTVHIPQLSRLDAIPTKYRRGILFSIF
jgi:hypothetical protein